MGISSSFEHTKKRDLGLLSSGGQVASIFVIATLLQQRLSKLVLLTEDLVRAGSCVSTFYFT